MSDQEQKELHKRKITKRLFLFLFLFSSTLLSHGKHIGQGDEPHYLVIAHSLFFDQDLDLQNNYTTDNPIGDGNLKVERHAMVGRDEKLYSIHSMGMPLIWAPILGGGVKIAEALPASTLTKVRMTRWTFIRLIVALSILTLTCWLAADMYQFLTTIISSRFAWIIVVVSFLSIPLLPMGFLFFTEIPAAFLAFQSFRFMRQQTSKNLALAAVFSAYLPFLHIKYVLLSAVLFVLLFKRSRKSLLLFIASLILVALYNFLLWGNVMPYAAYGDNPLSLRNLWQGILGLFLDQEFGLLWFSPIYLLVPAGFYLLCKKNQQIAFELLFLLAPTIFISAAYPMWWGGWSPAARFLTPAIIFCLPFVAQALETLWKFKIGRFISSAFLTIQLFLAMLFWFKPKLMWNYGDGETDLYQLFINGYTYSLPSLITFSTEDVVPCLVWGTGTLLIVTGCFWVVQKRKKDLLTLG